MDSNQIWTELNSKLDEIRIETKIDVQLMDDWFQNKCKELNSIAKEIKKLNKEKEKTEQELESVEKSINKAQSNISKAEDICQQIKDYNAKTSKKIEENKENMENVMNVWNIIGLRLEMKDNIMSIKFTKILESDPNKCFTVRLSIKDDHQIKVVDCDPNGSLDYSLIEDRFNKTSADTKIDLRHLIAFIRSHLKRKTLP